MYEEIISIPNLLKAYKQAFRGKKNKYYGKDFDYHRELYLYQLHTELREGSYIQGRYNTFEVFDPKKRLIFAAPFRDRIVHQAICSVLVPIWEQKFIQNSYACRKDKGVHRAVKKFEYFWKKEARGISHKEVYVLKTDIKTYFDSVDQGVLYCLLQKEIECVDTLALLKQILDGYRSKIVFDNGNLFEARKVGIPIGNLTSQLFANIYLNELDWYVIGHLKEERYLRYMDDLVVFSSSKAYLENIINRIECFLKENLYLKLHPSKTQIIKTKQGVDYLGYNLYLHSRKVRNKSYRVYLKKRRKYVREVIDKKISFSEYEKALASWWGIRKFVNEGRI